MPIKSSRIKNSSHLITGIFFKIFFGITIDYILLVLSLELFFFFFVSPVKHFLLLFVHIFFKIIV